MCGAGSEGDGRYSSSHVQLLSYMGLGGQLHTLATLLPWKHHITHCTWGWVVL